MTSRAEQLGMTRQQYNLVMGAARKGAHLFDHLTIDDAFTDAWMVWSRRPSGDSMTSFQLYWVCRDAWVKESNTIQQATLQSMMDHGYDPPPPMQEKMLNVRDMPQTLLSRLNTEGPGGWSIARICAALQCLIDTDFAHLGCSETITPGMPRAKSDPSHAGDLWVNYIEIKAALMKLARKDKKRASAVLLRYGYDVTVEELGDRMGLSRWQAGDLAVSGLAELFDIMNDKEKEGVLEVD